MTPALPPVMPQPAAPQSRDTAGALGVDAQRPVRAARGAETARAVRPVEGAAGPADARLTTRRDRPVGPPPAFTINLLQHLRETALDPPEPEKPGEGRGEGRDGAAESRAPGEARPEARTEPRAESRAEPSEPRPRREDQGYPAARLPAEDGVAPQVDIKL